MKKVLAYIVFSIIAVSIISLAVYVAIIEPIIDAWPKLGYWSLLVIPYVAIVILIIYLIYRVFIWSVDNL